MATSSSNFSSEFHWKWRIKSGESVRFICWPWPPEPFYSMPSTRIHCSSEHLPAFMHSFLRTLLMLFWWDLAWNFRKLKFGKCAAPLKKATVLLGGSTVVFLKAQNAFLKKKLQNYCRSWNFKISTQKQFFFNSK